MNSQILKDSLILETNMQEPSKMFHGVLFEEIEDDYGNKILQKVESNAVVFSGAILALEHLADVTANFKPATLNAIYNLNSGVAGDNKASFVKLFGCGTGGAALDFGNVKKPNIKQREILNFIPLRTGATVTGVDAAKYFFKKPISSGSTFNWYLKEFDSPTIIKSLWKDSAEQGTDGTEIVEEIFDSVRTEGIESFAEFKIKINNNDVREYFESIGELDMARYNSIGLFTGQKVAVAGGTDYVNVRLFSVVNFENKAVKERQESQYIYRVYSLV